MEYKDIGILNENDFRSRVMTSYLLDNEVVGTDVDRMIVLLTYLCSDFKEYESRYDKKKKGVGSLIVATDMDDNPKIVLECRNTYRSVKSKLQYHYLGHLEDINFEKVTQDMIIDALNCCIKWAEDEDDSYTYYARPLTSTLMFNYHVRKYDKEKLYDRILKIGKYPEFLEILVNNLKQYKNWQVDLIFNEIENFEFRGIETYLYNQKKNKED